MRLGIHLITLIFTLCLPFVLLDCNSKTKKGNTQSLKPGEKKSPGKIAFDKEIHNFGTLYAGEIVSYSFIFKNTGGSPFRFVKVEKSCGCIEVKYSKADILPGGTSSIEVVLDSGGEWGNLLLETTLETSYGDKKELHIGAYIENKQFNNNLNTQK